MLAPFPLKMLPTWHVSIQYNIEDIMDLAVH